MHGSLIVIGVFKKIRILNESVTAGYQKSIFARRNITKMPKSKTVAAAIFFCGMILLCLFFTPFIHNISGELVHARITFVGKLLVGRFLLYIALLAAICSGVAKLAGIYDPK